MAQLLEQSIKTLYQGVSRQPDAVRLPGQVEDAENVTFSVVTGGFTSRPSTSHICEVPSVTADEEVSVHAYSRDNTEQYLVVVKNESVQVLDLDGNEYEVTSDDGTSYLAATLPGDAFSFTTIGDTTIIANNEIVTELASPPATPTTFKALIHPRTSNANTKYVVKIIGATTTTYTLTTTTAQSNTQVGDNIYNNLTLPAGVTKSRVGDTIVYTASSDFKVTITGSDFTYGPQVNKDVVQYREYLAGEAPDGFKVKIGQSLTADGYWAEYSEDNKSWIESSDPTISNAFNLETMPHLLVRNADGTFTFKKGSWEPRAVGDDETAENPAFVGKKIKDVVFYRNRLALIATETVTFSQAGKFFNMWPQYITQVLDDDSFGVTASSTTVNNLQFAVAFRKALFLAAPKSQFEVSSDGVMTPKNTTVDLATTYATEVQCRPVAVGNLLYFASRMGKDALLFEYSYDDNSLTNVAVDVTMHVLGYIPAPVVKLAGDSAASTLFVLTESERNAIYTYQTYIDGDKKAQSAWSRWTFGDSTILWMGTVSSALYMLVRRNGKTYLEAVKLRYDLGDDGHPFRLSMDRQTLVDGVYDELINTTEFTLPYYCLNPIGTLSTEFQVGEQGARLILEPVEESYNLEHGGYNKFRTFGDYAGVSGDLTTIFGIPLRSSVVLSNIFYRDPAAPGRTTVSGRLQLRRMTFNYRETGYFRVGVTPQFRDKTVFTFNGKLIGSGSNQVGSVSIERRGSFKCPAQGRADATQVEIYNDSEKPFTITSVDWIGVYNEITRQG
jgi:hypothetical protein